MLRKQYPLLLILLLALSLRLYRLTEIPPGLTHDEANHGREAIGILDGNLRFYFPLNYGSEPVYSYTVAGSMALFGETVWALRLVNVLFGVAAIAMTAVWAARAFDKRVALLTAALMAVSFWPLASSREALRAGMLPFFMAAAVYFFWQLVIQTETGRRVSRRALVSFAVCLAFTLHIYLAARVAWLLFPLFLGYLALAERPRFRRLWRPVLVGLALTALLVTPMFVYLRLNPWVQTRLSMLDKPLQQIMSGDFNPTLRNAGEALLAFIWPGYGDQFLAYNIPGRPVFDALTAVFFLIGLLTAVIPLLPHARRAIPDAPHPTPHARIFLLIWFFIGILPSLITGPTANTTRNLAALPAVYILPALGFVCLLDWLGARLRQVKMRVLSGTAVSGTAIVWLLFAGSVAVYDYFVQWGNAPDVRGAYQVTQLAMLDYVARQPTGATTPVTISTIYPGAAHDPSIALVTHPQLNLRWADARYALIWPGGKATHAIIPASTPPHPALAAWLHPLGTVAMRQNDLDTAFTYYELTALPPDWLDVAPLANFDDAVLLQQAFWLDDAVAEGGTAVLLTVWLVLDPMRIGPLHPATEATNAVLFTQALTAADILAQRDSLEAPSWGWQPGDVIVQLHPILVPVGTLAGEYPVIVGLYDRDSGERRPVVDADGALVGTYATVPPLRVINP